MVGVIKPDGRALLASAAVPDALQGFPPDRPPVKVVQIPFASNEQRQVQITINSAGENRIAASLGTMKLFELGESSYGWTLFAPRNPTSGAETLYDATNAAVGFLWGCAFDYCFELASTRHSDCGSSLLSARAITSAHGISLRHCYSLFPFSVGGASAFYWFSFNLWRGTRELFRQIKRTSS